MRLMCWPSQQGRVCAAMCAPSATLCALLQAVTSVATHSCTTLLAGHQGPPAAHSGPRSGPSPAQRHQQFCRALYNTKTDSPTSLPTFCRMPDTSWAYLDVPVHDKPVHANICRWVLPVLVAFIVSAHQPGSSSAKPDLRGQGARALSGSVPLEGGA